MIVFVVLHYQAIEETINCIDSIRQNIKDNYKIIIVDNASPNKTGIKLAEDYKDSLDIEVVINKENVGFAKGNNIGYRRGKQFNPDYICVLNSDIVFTGDTFVDELYAAQKKYDFDVLGPDIYSTRTNSHQNPQRETNYTLKELIKYINTLLLKNKLKFLLHLKYLFAFSKRGEKKKIDSETDFRTTKENVVLHGAFYVFSRKFITKHDNCFYNNTFMYFESYILHYLGMKENLKFVYYPKIQIIHHEDASTDYTYTTKYKKSVFVNKCLLDSCKEFIRLFYDKSLIIG